MDDIGQKLEDIVFQHNNDERHIYPDPCQVCEILDAIWAVRQECGFSTANNTARREHKTETPKATHRAT